MKASIHCLFLLLLFHYIYWQLTCKWSNKIAHNLSVSRPLCAKRQLQTPASKKIMPWCPPSALPDYKFRWIFSMPWLQICLVKESFCGFETASVHWIKVSLVTKLHLSCQIELVNRIAKDPISTMPESR